MAAMAATAVPMHVIDMPGWRPILKRVLTTIAMVSFLPAGIFYVSMSLFGVRVAALVTIGLYYSALALKFLRRKPVLAAAMLAAGFLSIRTVVMFVTGSAFVYFLQPVAGTVLLATTIGVTALAGRPILDRLAHDFCPFPEDLSARLRKTGFFVRLSIIWTMSFHINAVGTVWLLSTASLGGFILMKSTLGPALTMTAVAMSLLYFRVAVRNQNVQIRFAHHDTWLAARA
jgi:hypothetical protein